MEGSGKRTDLRARPPNDGRRSSNVQWGTWFFVFLAFVFTLLGTDGTWKGKNCQKNQWWEMWETTWKEMKEQTKGRNNERTKGKTGKKAFRRFVSLFNLILPSRLGFFTHTHARSKRVCCCSPSNLRCYPLPIAPSPRLRALRTRWLWEFPVPLGFSCFFLFYEKTPPALSSFSLSIGRDFSLFQSVDVASSSVLLPTKEWKMLRQQEEEEEGASKDKGGVYLMGRADKRWWWPLCNCSR